MWEKLKFSNLFAYALEEAAILSWEKILYEYLHDPKHTKLLDNWSRAIERKMK